MYPSHRGRPDHRAGADRRRYEPRKSQFGCDVRLHQRLHVPRHPPGRYTRDRPAVGGARHRAAVG